MAKNKEFEKKYKEEGKRRMKLRKQKRLERIASPSRRGRFVCDMDYDECNLRGYCNGDC